MWLSQPSDFYFFCQLVAFAQSLDFPFMAIYGQYSFWLLAFSFWLLAFGFLIVAKNFSPYFRISSHTDSIRGSVAFHSYIYLHC
jgi:hypothetical protein